MINASDLVNTELRDTLFFAACQKAGVPEPVTEHRFHPMRRWRFDYAWPDCTVALEVEGGVWSRKRGRHVRGRGYIGDMEKYNEASLRGWTLIRVTPDQLFEAATMDMLTRAMRRAA